MLRASLVTSLIALAALASACDKTDKTTPTTAPVAQPTSASTINAATPTGEGKGGTTAMTPEKDKKKEPIVTFKNVGLSTPESVLHDDAADVYLVSNIEGQPADVDGKGFISRLTPDGKVETLKWIESGKNKVTLNAPKGLALVGETLYVADIDTVRMFDRKTGMPQGEVKVPGATFLNDLASTADGRVLVSDSGLDKKFASTGTDAIYAIDKTKKLTTVAKSKDLGGPNGLHSAGDKTWVATFGSGELYSLDAKGKKADVKKLPKGQLDGIVALPSGDLLVSSWDANAVYRGKPGGDFTPVVENVKSPADIGYDMKRGRVLVPLFNENEVQVYEVK